MRQRHRQKDWGRQRWQHLVPTSLYLPLLLSCIILAIAAGEAQARVGILFDKPFYSYLKRPQWEATLGYDYDLTVRKTPVATNRNSSHRFTEGLSLTTGGWLYHPALTRYDLVLEPQWEQSRDRSSGGRSTSRNRFTLGFGIDGILLPNKPYPLRYFAHRRSANISSSRAQGSTLITDRYGLSMTMPWKQLPTFVGYTRTVGEREGLVTTSETHDSVRWQSSNRSERQHTLLTANYDLRNRTAGSGQTRTTEDASGRLSNLLYLTDNRNLRLASAASGRWAETAEGSRTGFSLRETLSWDVQLTENLSSGYSTDYSYEDNDGNVTQSYGLNGQLSHQLYENLTSTLSGNAQRQSSDQRQSDSYGGALNFGYGRRIPGGFLNLNLGNSYQVNREEINVDLLPREITLQFDGGFMLLPDEGILVETIRVNSVDGTQVFVENIDYEIFQAGERVEIFRLDTGVIAPEQSVVVEYTYRTRPGFDSATRGLSYGVRLNLWQYWSFYYSASRARQEYLAGIRPDVLNDSTSQNYGAAYNWQGERARAQLSVDMSDSESATGDATKSMRLAQTYNLRWSQRLSSGVGTNYSKTSIKETGREIENYGVNADLRWQPWPHSQLALLGFYRKTTSNVPLESEVFGFATTYNYRYRLWTLSGEYSYNEDRDTLSDRSTSRHRLSMLIKRALF